MKVRELVALLQHMPQEASVMILNGENGGGLLRDMNLGPVQKYVRPNDADETADCEGREGERVVAIGFGCY